MEKIGYRHIFKQKEYCKIIIANMINRFGDSIDAIAYTWLVYAVTGSASWSAIIYALNTLPSIVLQPFTGAVVERKSKKKIMVVSDLIRGLTVAVLVLIYVRGMMNPSMLVIFTLLTSSVEAYCLPASTAILPLVLEEKYYEQGISLDTALSTVFQLVGTAAAGIIIGVFGIEIAILIDAVTFFASACMKLSVKIKEDIHEFSGLSPMSQYFKDLKEGFLYMKKKRELANFCILAFLINAMMVPLNSFLAPLVSDVLGQGSEMLSVIGTAMVLGMGIGSVIFPYISKKSAVYNLILVLGLGLSGFSAMLPFGSMVKGNTAAVYMLSITSAVGVGFFSSLLNVELHVQFLKAVDQDYLARAQSLLGAGSMAAIPLTSILLGIVVNYVSVKDIMILGSVLCALAFIGFRWMNTKFEEENEEKNHILQSD